MINQIPTNVGARLSSFDPATNLDGLVAWFDPSDGSTLFDQNSGGSLVSVGGIVRRMEDKSGNGLHVTGDSSAGMILSSAAIGGLNALTPNSNGSLLYDGAFPSGSQFPFRYSLVLDSLASSAASRFQFVYNLTDLSETSEGKYGLSFGAITSSADFSRSPIVVTAEVITGTDALYINGSLVGAGNVAEEAQGVPSIRVSAISSNIAEILVYADDARADVEAYLAAKWGIALA